MPLLWESTPWSVFVWTMTRGRTFLWVGNLGGSFKYVLFSPLFAEDSHFEYFQMGWNHHPEMAKLVDLKRRIKSSWKCKGYPFPAPALLSPCLPGSSWSYCWWFRYPASHLGCKKALYIMGQTTHWTPTSILLMEEILHHLGCMKPCK